MTRLALVLTTSVLLAACASTDASTGQTAARPAAGTATVRIVALADVTWEQLNPARGDASPKAGTLFGDRGAPGATGFLLKPTDGFESPPHIHNTAYRGVVISGTIHNDHPDREVVWMPTGSYWTQPEGGVHITAARGPTTLAYIEVDEGPFHVRPVAEQFPAREQAINVGAADITWQDLGPGGAQVVFPWGSAAGGGPGGILVRVPPQASAVLRSHGSPLHGVAIQGQLTHRLGGDPAARGLAPGSALHATGPGVHRLACDPGADCILYVRSEGGVTVEAGPGPG